MDATPHDDVPAGTAATADPRSLVEIGWALVGVGALLGLVLDRAHPVATTVRALAVLVLLAALVVSLRRHRGDPAAGAAAGLVVAGTSIAAALT